VPRKLGANQGKKTNYSLSYKEIYEDIVKSQQFTKEIGAV